MDSDIAYLLVIAGGLVLFTYLLFVSRKQKKKLNRRRERIKRDWTNRL
jgi:O-antigen/teichoic acid export membrane protein